MSVFLVRSRVPAFEGNFFYQCRCQLDSRQLFALKFSHPRIYMAVHIKPACELMKKKAHLCHARFMFHCRGWLGYEQQAWTTYLNPAFIPRNKDSRNSRLSSHYYYTAPPSINHLSSFTQLLTR